MPVWSLPTTSHGAITQNYGLGEAAVLAVEAGCDVLLVCHEASAVEEAYTALLEAVDTGRLSQERLMRASGASSP